MGGKRVLGAAGDGVAVRAPAGQTVLVADDDRPIRMLVTDVLQTELGVRVVEVANGYDAIQRLAANPPDLILLDLRMPFVDGTAVLRWLGRHPSPHPVRVVAFTAAGLPGIEQLMGLGCDDALVKPFDLNDLLTTVRRNLSVEA